MLLFWFRNFSKHLACTTLFFLIRANSWINSSMVLIICRIEASIALPSSPRSRCTLEGAKWWPESSWRRRRQRRLRARRHVAPGVRGGSTAARSSVPPLRSPSPPGPLTHQQHAPAAARARRIGATPCTPCAAQARSRQGQKSEHTRARHATAPCPPCSPASPQHSRTLHRPTASTHGRGCPLHRVHRAPPDHYKSAPRAPLLCTPLHCLPRTLPSPLCTARRPGPRPRSLGSP